MYKTLQSVYPTPARKNNPLALCLADDMDRHFLFGASTAEHTGPRSETCQKYMIQRCSNNWDEYCDVAYERSRQNYTPIYKPNPYADYLEQLKYTQKCEKEGGCEQKTMLLAPTDPYSEKVSFYEMN